MPACWVQWMPTVATIRTDGIQTSSRMISMISPNACWYYYRPVDLKAEESTLMQRSEETARTPADLFYAHIGGIDVFARALITADNVLQKSDYNKMRKARYASFDSEDGKAFEEGKLSMEDLRAYAIEHGEPEIISGRQEYMENIINRYI